MVSEIGIVPRLTMWFSPINLIVKQMFLPNRCCDVSFTLGFEPTTLDMLPSKIPRGRRVLGYQNDA